MTTATHHSRRHRHRSLAVGTATFMGLAVVVAAGPVQASASESVLLPGSVGTPVPAHTDEELHFDPDTDDFATGGSVSAGHADYRRFTTHARGLRLTVRLDGSDAQVGVTLSSMPSGTALLRESTTRGMGDTWVVETSTFVLAEPGEYRVMVDGAPGRDFDYELSGSLPGHRLGSPEHPEFGEGTAAVCTVFPAVGLAPADAGTPVAIHTDEALRFEPSSDEFTEGGSVPSGYADYRDFTTHASGLRLTVRLVTPDAQVWATVFAASSGSWLTHETTDRRLVGTDIVDTSTYVLAEPGTYRMMIDGPAARDFEYELSGSLPGRSDSDEHVEAGDSLADTTADLAGARRLTVDSGTHADDITGTLAGAAGELWVMAVAAGQTVTIEQLGDRVKWQLSTESGDAVGCGVGSGVGEVHIDTTGDHYLRVVATAHDRPSDYRLRIDILPP